ncbi:MAG: SocA family protein [Desulfurococcales archaeon]|nr:SocA family protein [Desulfurococcales archaeon]
MGGVSALFYLIRRHYELHGDLQGRKKLQKLMFLVEHLDPERGRLTPSTGLTGYKFVIWLYGPFSQSIYKDLDRLVDEGFVEEEVVSGERSPRFRNLNLLLYDDDGYPKLMYIYRPTRPKFLIFKLRRKANMISEPSPPVKEKIDLILDRFGHQPAWELERNVLEMLGLSPEEKLEWMGKSVDEYLRYKLLSGKRHQ